MAVLCLCRAVFESEVTKLYKTALCAGRQTTPGQLFLAAAKSNPSHPCNICMGDQDSPEEDRMMARVRKIMAEVDNARPNILNIIN